MSLDISLKKIWLFLNFLQSKDSTSVLILSLASVVVEFIVILWLSTSVTRKLNKILPNICEKEAKNTKLSTSKLNLKAQHPHI